MGIQSVVIDMTGQKIGKLTVLSRGPNNKRGGVHWNCICECGKTTTVWGTHLRTRRTISCGCAKKDGAMKTAKQTLSKDPRKTSARHVFSQQYNDGDLTFEIFLSISQFPCYYCGTLPNKSNCYNRYKTRYNDPNRGCALDDLSLGNFFYNGLDRIDNTKLHNTNNVVPCCKWCNQAKMDRTLEEFKTWIRQLHNHLFAQKETDSNCLESVSELSVI